jgi:hypothetical protein
MSAMIQVYPQIAQISQIKNRQWKNKKSPRGKSGLLSIGVHPRNLRTKN